MTGKGQVLNLQVSDWAFFILSYYWAQSKRPEIVVPVGASSLSLVHASHIVHEAWTVESEVSAV